MLKQILIIAAAVAAVELTNFIISISRRKMVCYTVMTLLNDVSALSEKGGYKSWIEYMQKTYGRQKALVFFNQLYATLQKNRFPDARLDELRGKLKAFLTQETDHFKAEAESGADGKSEAPAAKAPRGFISAANYKAYRENLQTEMKKRYKK